MAAAGAALALLLEKVDPPATNAELANLLSTVVLWATSFLFGCMAVITDQRVWSTTFTAQRIADKDPRIIGTDSAKQRFEEWNTITRHYVRLGEIARLAQLITIAMGSLLYVAYRVVQWFPDGNLPPN